MPFCPKCGAEVPSDAVFCPKCGAQIIVFPTPSPAIPPAEYRQCGEKREKEEKGEKHEKGAGHGDMSGAIVGGLILIWLGITFYMIQVGYLPSSVWWSYFLIGIGVILLIQAVIRYATLPYKGSARGEMIGGFIVLIIGLAGASRISNWWFLIFIIIGIAIIVSGITAARRSPKP